MLGWRDERRKLGMIHIHTAEMDGGRNDSESKLRTQAIRIFLSVIYFHSSCRRRRLSAYFWKELNLAELSEFQISKATSFALILLIV